MVAPDKLKRLFIQSYLLERCAREDNVLNLYRKLCDHFDRPYRAEDLASFITDVNQALDTVDMELRKGHSPEDGATYYALVNTNGDEVAQMATECTPTEITYFKHLIESIVNADDEVYELSSTVALAAATRMKPAMTKRDAEAFIERLIKDKWLVDRNGLISMSLRTVLELQTYLKEEYPDKYYECTLCMEIVTTDYERCSIANCQTRLHAYCSRAYFSRGNQTLCPSCQSPWRGIPLGTGQSSSRSIARRVSRKMPASQATLDFHNGDAQEEEEQDEDVIMDDGADSEDGGEDEEEDEPVRRSTPRGRGRAGIASSSSSNPRKRQR